MGLKKLYKSFFIKNVFEIKKPFYGKTTHFRENFYYDFYDCEYVVLKKRIQNFFGRGRKLWPNLGDYFGGRT